MEHKCAKPVISIKNCTRFDYTSTGCSSIKQLPSCPGSKVYNDLLNVTEVFPCILSAHVVKYSNKDVEKF